MSLNVTTPRQRRENPESTRIRNSFFPSSYTVRQLPPRPRYDTTVEVSDVSSRFHVFGYERTYGQDQNSSPPPADYDSYDDPLRASERDTVRPNNRYHRIIGRFGRFAERIRSATRNSAHFLRRKRHVYGLVSSHAVHTDSSVEQLISPRFTSERIPTINLRPPTPPSLSAWRLSAPLDGRPQAHLNGPHTRASSYPHASLRQVPRPPQHRVASPQRTLRRDRRRVQRMVPPLELPELEARPAAASYDRSDHNPWTVDKTLPTPSTEQIRRALSDSYYPAVADMVTMQQRQARMIDIPSTTSDVSQRRRRNIPVAGDGAQIVSTASFESNSWDVRLPSNIPGGNRRQHRHAVAMSAPPVPSIDSQLRHGRRLETRLGEQAILPLRLPRRNA